jgi:hypothetical protein
VSNPAFLIPLIVEAAGPTLVHVRRCEVQKYFPILMPDEPIFAACASAGIG